MLTLPVQMLYSTTVFSNHLLTLKFMHVIVAIFFKSVKHKYHVDCIALTDDV